MSWGIVAGAAASVIGGALSAKGAKDAAKSAAAGSTEEIEYLKQSRDLARADQAPYRKAGVTALNALMSMTGLGGGPTAGPAMPAIQVPGNVQDRFEQRFDESRNISGSRDSSYTRLRYDGGPTGETHYNINELGPENYYRGGAITRGRNPVTIDGETGYIEPYTEGRALGGPTFGGNIKIPDPNIPLTSGPPNVGPAGNPPNVGNNSALYPKENPGGVEGGYNFMTEPGYQFRFEEGMRALDRSAAARGGLLSGGYGRRAIRYGQGFASNEYSNVYNRIANIAGLGQVGATNSGNAALMAGQGIGNAASNRGNATAYGQIQSGNAWANAANEIAKLPWGKEKN